MTAPKSTLDDARTVGDVDVVEKSPYEIRITVLDDLCQVGFVTHLFFLTSTGGSTLLDAEV